MSATRFRVALLAVAAVAGFACAESEQVAMPRCQGDRRLAIVAQSVTEAAYVPCVGELPPGWSFESLDVERGRTRMSLRSDRADEPVEVDLTSDCDVAGTTPVAPRDEGVRTHQRLASITPDYAGELIDVFPGGCVTTHFEFGRGAHIALMEELQRAVRLYPRRQLRQEVRDATGIDVDP